MNLDGVLKPYNTPDFYRSAFKNISVRQLRPGDPLLIDLEMAGSWCLVDGLIERNGEMVPVLITDKTIQCFLGNTPYVTITIPGLEVSVELALNIVRNEENELDIMVTTVEGRKTNEPLISVHEGLPEISVPKDCPVYVKVVEVLGRARPPRAFSVEIYPKDPHHKILKTGVSVSSTVTQMQLNSARNIYVLGPNGEVVNIAHIKLVNGENGLEILYREKEVGPNVEG